MAKKMKKVLALVLALALCAGQIAIPVGAADVANDAAPAKEVTITLVEGGTQTVTVTTDTATGSQTKVTEVVTANPEAGTSSQSTTTEVVTVSGGGTQTDVNTDWQSTSTQTGSETQTGNPTVQTDTNVTTTVTGSEDMTQTITHDNATGIETIEGNSKGEENTDIVGTTVTTTTTKDVLFSDENSSNTNESSTSKETPTTSGWVEGDVTEGEWEEGEIQQGTASTTGTTNKRTEIDATNPGKAVIEMAPDGETVEVFVDVTIDQVLAGVEIPEDAVEVKKDGKVVGYKIVKVTETSTPDANPIVGETTENLGTPTQTAVAPNGYTEGTVTNGNVTTVTEAIKDENGAVIGYRVTKTTVTENAGSSTIESTQDTTTETTTGKAVFTLPARPEETETTDDNGYVTKTVVEDIVEDGRVVGYKSTTTYYSPEGETMRTESNSIFGTTSSSNTLIEKDPETEVETVKTTTTKTEVNEIYTTISTRDVTLLTERTNNITTTIVTEEDYYQLVETEDGLYFLYKGTMQPVVALSGHGDVTVKGLTPTATPNSKNDLASTTSVYNPPSIVNPGAPGSDQFKYIDYGLISDFRITKENGYNTSEVHLYKLVDQNGNAYYAYCADLDTTAYRNTIYDISNVEDEDYYQNNEAKDAHEHLQTIAMNGYWGTSSGTGSMAAIKQLLIDNGYTTVANSITDGEAMTATQAAIWAFGNKSSSNLINTDNPAANVADWTSRRNIKTLYDLLVSDALKNATPSNETDIINEGDITGATLELKGKATDTSTGTVVTDSNGNEMYKADLTFTLDVEESALTGNLKVIVKDAAGNVLREEQLLTENSNLFGRLIADNGSTNGYYYTIENLEIAEGVKINLNLEGYQNLQKGVYIYTAATGSHEDSQTFIGVAEGKRDVNLQVELNFTVEDPQLEYVDKSTTQTRNDTRVDKKEDTRTDTCQDTLETNKTTTKVVTDTNVKVYGTETVTETKKDITKENRNWESYWKYILQTINGDDWTDGEENDGGVDILDEEVPLADAPKTGDISALWVVVSCLSATGMLLLRKKREDAE